MNTTLTGYPSKDKPWKKWHNKEIWGAPLPQMTMYRYLYENSKEHIDKTALTYYGARIDYKTLLNKIDETACALKAIGVDENSILTVIMPSTPEAVYLIYAVNKLGGACNMVDPRTSPEGILEYINEVDSSVLVVIDAAYEKAKKILNKTNVKTTLVISPMESLSTDAGGSAALDDNCIDWKRFIEGGRSESPSEYEYQKDRMALITHTGGTTGKSKGVMLTNDNINAEVFQVRYAGFDFRQEHRWLSIMPPFIAYGVIVTLHMPLVVGMEVILIPKFDADKFDELLLKHQPNHVTGVPSHYSSIVSSTKLSPGDLSFLISPMMGGDALDPLMEERINSCLHEYGCNTNCIKGYGMTEVSAAACVTPNNERNRIGSVGIPLTHSVVSVFDPETGEELPYNTQGEVCISGPNIMLGYYKDEEETENMIKRHKDGVVWAHTGDIGYMTEDGFLYIVGRVKRMIVRHDGFKVFPSMIEKVISGHKAVRSCCVVGMPDKDHSQGKLPKAYIVLEDDHDQEHSGTEQELRELCRNELPEYAQPVGFEFRDELPLTRIGKIDFRALEKQ